MRRYRTVILVFVFGIVPMVAALVLGVTVLLPSLQQADQEEPGVVVEAPPPPEPVVVRVALTADRTLSPGMLLTNGDLALEEVNDIDVPLPGQRYVYVGNIEEDADTDSPEQASILRGYAVRRTVAAGEPVAWSAVVGPNDAQFLATVLAADRVAVSIPVDLANRQARLVSPGNRVDVLLAVEQTGELVVRTIVEDVRVLAVNHRMIAEEDVRTGGPDRSEGADTNTAAEPPEVATVTLEVTPVQGEHLALGTRVGQLSLAIRPDGGSPFRPEGPMQDLRSVLRLPEPEPEPEPMPPSVEPVSVRIIRGTSEETVVFGGTGPDSQGLMPPERDDAGLSGDLETPGGLMEMEGMMPSVGVP